MANYNPKIPQILGDEWVPIRDEDLVLDPFTNNIERGYGFTVDTASAVNNVRFYINEFPPLFVRNQGYTANIYPRGEEANSGPVGRVIIPCNSGGLDSPNSNLVTSPSTSSVAECVYNPSANYFLNWQVGGTSYNTASFFFATNSYAQLLNGKRILGVNLLTGINVVVASAANPDDFATTFAGWLYPLLTNDAQYAASQDDGFVIYRPLVTFQTPVNTRLLVRTRMGDTDVPYNNAGTITAATPNVSQWTYPELQRFESGAGASRLFVTLHSQALAGGVLGAQVLVLYMALEVFYCEERRAAFGTRNINGLRIVQARDPFQLGMNQIIVRSPTGSTNPSLPAGDYTVTLSEANTGDDFNVAYSPFETAKVNELRQLYEIPSLPGIQVNLPFPLNEEAIGATFTKESTDLVPQLSMHNSSLAVYHFSHGYGRQAAGQVYGTNFVSQDIDDSTISSGTIYPYVRYYARRFGSTTVPLKLSAAGPGAGLLVAPGGLTAPATTPDTAALDITGDIELRADAAILDWSAGQVLVGKWPAAGAGNPGSSYRLALDSGTLQFVWSTTGTDLGIASSISFMSLIAGGSSRLAVAVQLDVNNGAGGKDIRFYTAPTMAGPWTQLGPTQTQGGTTSIFSSTTNVAVGSNADGSERASGIIYAAQILNGVPAGTAVANPNFAAQAPGTTSFADAAGRTWTINSPAAIVGGLSSASSVSITPAEFDALDEVLDGWKEVRLRFTTPPTMGGSLFPRFLWTATGELPGSRWEVLGASAYAASGIAQQMNINLQLGQVPTAQQLYASTYSAPTYGTAMNMEWLPQLGPYVSGSVTDYTADVSVIFAQDMPAVTGFTVSVASQALTGIGLDCGISPCGIPTHILYNQLQWGLPVNTGIAYDSFTRTVAGGFGSADRGGAYTLSSSAADYAVNGTQGAITPSAANVQEVAVLSNIGTNADVTVIISSSSPIITGTSARGAAVARYLNSSNYYVAYVQTTQSTGLTVVGLQKTVAGVDTFIDSAQLNTSIDNGNQMKLRFSIQGSLLRAKAWSIYVDEPEGWQLEANDSSLLTGSSVGVAGRSGSTTGNIILFDELTVTPPSWGFGYYELQRSDSITEWQTIMKATSPEVTGFKDFEARVDMSSSYRIRGVDAYEFAGPWSSTVSLSTISPGVSGSCLTNAHVMIFTTNERQDGSSNLAYSNAWEGEVVESFSFAEASFTQLQPMYDRDFFTAFRPSERGGDQFSRSLLVQAAAIAPETLADFTSLRNLAWEDVSYVCVRDEEGNRWFANINVPSGVVRNRRRLYQAEIQIVEVTDTPSPVDP